MVAFVVAGPFSARRERTAKSEHPMLLNSLRRCSAMQWLPHAVALSIILVTAGAADADEAIVPTIADAVAQAPTPASAPELPAAAPQGFLWNISSRPFSFRVRRVHGPSWTEIETLMPGEKRERRGGDEFDIFGLTAGVKPRFIVVRYPAYGGVIEERLSSRTTSRGEVLMPFHFVIDDAHGEHTTLQVDGLEKAEAAQAAFRAKRIASLEPTRRQLWQVGLLILHPLYYGFGGGDSWFSPSALWLGGCGTASCAECCSQGCGGCAAGAPPICCEP